MFDERKMEYQPLTVINEIENNLKIWGIIV